MPGAPAVPVVTDGTDGVEGVAPEGIAPPVFVLGGAAALPARPRLGGVTFAESSAWGFPYAPVSTESRSSLHALMATTPTAANVTLRAPNLLSDRAIAANSF